MARPKTPAKVFKAAAAAIEKHGHAIGLLQAWDNHSMCLRGAINFVMCGDALHCSIETGDMIDRLMPLTGGNPVVWNNRPGRTKSEVVDLLRKAARAESR